MKKCIAIILLLIPTLCFGIDTVNEKSQATLTVSFKDENGTAVIPTKFIYWSKDVVTNTTLKVSTTINPVAASYAITIPSNENRIIDTRKSHEDKKVSVEWYSGVTLIGTADYTYRVNNLSYIPIP
jgi:hypothetical protein